MPLRAADEAPNSEASETSARPAATAVVGLPAPPAIFIIPEARSTLPEGTLVMVGLMQDLTTADSRLGDPFEVTVLRDVIEQDTVVIPQGTIGHGEVTTLITKGSFGKAGIIGIALRSFEMDGRRYALDGRYREQGDSNSDAAAATMFTAGLFAALVKGKGVGIPAGRELRARTGEEIRFVVGAAPRRPAPPVPDACGPAATGAPPLENSSDAPSHATPDSGRCAQADISLTE